MVYHNSILYIIVYSGFFWHFSLDRDCATLSVAMLSAARTSKHPHSNWQLLNLLTSAETTDFVYKGCGTGVFEGSNLASVPSEPSRKPLPMPRRRTCLQHFST